MARPGGVRLRATLAAVLTVSVALGVASAGLLLALQGSLKSSARDEAIAKAKAAAAAVAVGDSPPGLPGKPYDVQVLRESTDGPIWKTGSAYVVAKAKVASDGKTMVIQGRSSLAPTRQAITSLRNLLVPGVPALLLLVALLTWIAVGRALKPVSAIRTKMADITAHDLHQRVPEPGSHDEIAALARTVNATLDRLGEEPVRTPRGGSAGEDFLDHLAGDLVVDLLRQSDESLPQRPATGPRPHRGVLADGGAEGFSAVPVEHRERDDQIAGGVADTGGPEVDDRGQFSFFDQ